MAGRRLRIYWDASVWVAWDNDEFNVKDLCTEILKEAEKGNIEIVVSALTYSEFCPSDENTKLLDDYLKRSSFIFVNINRVIASNARQLVKKYQGLRGPDAVHIACAIYAKVDMVFSFDKHHLRKDNPISEIKVCEPTWPFEQQILVFEAAATKTE